MIKHITYTFLLVALLISSAEKTMAQDKIKWYSIEEALKMAAHEPRVLVIDVYTDWCGWCKKMDANTFSDPGIIEQMNSKFYPVKMDAEGKADVVIGDKTFKHVDNGRRGYHEIAAVVTKGRLSYPTISYVDATGKVLQAAPGYKTADQFNVYLAYYSSGSHEKQSFEQFSAAYTTE